MWEVKGHQPRMLISLLRPPSTHGVPSFAASEGFCWTVNMSALLASAAATVTGESKQQCAPPPPHCPCPNVLTPPLGCSALDYMALLADVLGLSSVDKVCTKLHGYTRHSKVKAYQAILESGPGSGSTSRAPKATQGLCGCSSPVALLMMHQTGP
jgi:hypothetical protein